MSRYRHIRRKKITRPANVVRLADDLVELQKPEDGLRELEKFINYREFFQPGHEDLMNRYVELSVQLRKTAKEGLTKFRFRCQSKHAPAAASELLGKILLYYCKVGQINGQKALAKIVSEMPDDRKEGEENQNKEKILEKKEPGGPKKEAASGGWAFPAHKWDKETKEDFDKRQFQCPELDYVWGAFKTVLEICRNNADLQKVYHAVIADAIDFCKSLRRTTEFRRLNDLLRYHLKSVDSYQNKYDITLTNPEICQVHLETRFSMLDAATHMELWFEAHRLIEDEIPCIMKYTQKVLRPELMMLYYKTLSELFWISKNYLFHAHCYYRYYELRLESSDGEKVHDEMDKACVLATLAIYRGGVQKGNNSVVSLSEARDRKMATTIGLKGLPRRSSLLTTLIRQKMIDPDDKNSLYYLLENDFCPLQLAKKVSPLLEAIKASGGTNKYVDVITNTVAHRVFEQLSTVYQTVKFENLNSLLPEGMGLNKIEKLIVSSDSLLIKVDHRNETLNFGDEQMESERMRHQLAIFSKRLLAAADKFNAVTETQKKKNRENVFRNIRQGVEAARQGVFVRLDAIEKRKQELEDRKVADQKIKRRKEEERQKKALEEEQKRLDVLRKKREEDRKQRLEAEKKEAALRALQDKITLVQGKTKKVPKKKVLKTNVPKTDVPAETKEPPKQDLVALTNRLREIEVHKQEEQRKKIRDESRRHDYLIRAMRLEEKDLLFAAAKKQKAKDIEAHKAELAKNRKRHYDAHLVNLEERTRLRKIEKWAKMYRENRMGERRLDFEEEKLAQDKTKEEHDKRRHGFLEKIRIAEERAAVEEERKLEEEERAMEKLRRQKEEQEAREQEQAVEERLRQDRLAEAGKNAQKEDAQPDTTAGQRDSILQKSKNPWRPSRNKGGGGGGGGGGGNRFQKPAESSTERKHTYEREDEPPEPDVPERAPERESAPENGVRDPVPKWEPKRTRGKQSSTASSAASSAAPSATPSVATSAATSAAPSAAPPAASSDASSAPPDDGLRRYVPPGRTGGTGRLSGLLAGRRSDSSQPSSGRPSNPFGAAGPTRGGRSDPFGGAKPRDDPYGGARPSSRATYGSAKPRDDRFSGTLDDSSGGARQPATPFGATTQGDREPAGAVDGNSQGADPRFKKRSGERPRFINSRKKGK